MGNIGYTGKILSEKLDSKTIRDGGLQQITIPILRCMLEIQKIEVGGYPSLVHYNIDRERQHKKHREHKRLRSLKRQIKRKASCQNGLDFPNPDTHLNYSRGIH